MALSRCPWCGDDPLYVAYHDREWGVPLQDDRGLFELLILEGAQAGLSWITVLRKRENYRRAFDGFDIDKIAGYGDADIERLMGDPGIVRNRLKIAATIANARACQQVEAEFGSLDAYLWSFVEGQPIRNAWRELIEVPAKTPLAEAMSKDLSRRGFKFVGPTICYAFMQAAGIVNDHLVDCHRYDEPR
jgi:DNA-3-methyladenine glycosylase I